MILTDTLAPVIVVAIGFIAALVAAETVLLSLVCPKVRIVLAFAADAHARAPQQSAIAVNDLPFMYL